MNKYNQEWGGEPVNYLSIDMLRALLEMLNDRYQIIYSRPTVKNIVGDNSLIYDFDDCGLISQYPGALTVQELHQTNPEFTFNTLQMMVYANCDRFISVQGGNSMLASYFARTNIIYVVRGMELMAGGFNTYHLFNNARVYPCMNQAEFLSTVKKLHAHDSEVFFSSDRLTCWNQMAKYNLQVARHKVGRLIGSIPKGSWE